MCLLENYVFGSAYKAIKIPLVFNTFAYFPTKWISEKIVRKNTK